MPANASRCSRCQSPQVVDGRGRRGSRSRVVTVNLEQGRPTVPEALFKLESALAAARLQGTPLLRIVHGYGSSGTGGAIRHKVREKLRALLKKGQIRSVVAGEDYTDATVAGRNLIARYPTMQKTIRSDRENEGITFVEVSGT